VVEALLVLEQFDATRKIDKEWQYGTEQSRGDGTQQDDRLDVDSRPKRSERFRMLEEFLILSLIFEHKNM